MLTTTGGENNPSVNDQKKLRFEAAQRWPSPTQDEKVAGAQKDFPLTQPPASTPSWDDEHDQSRTPMQVETTHEQETRWKEAEKARRHGRTPDFPSFFQHGQR